MHVSLLGEGWGEGFFHTAHVANIWYSLMYSSWLYALCTTWGHKKDVHPLVWFKQLQEGLVLDKWMYKEYRDSLFYA